MKDFAVRTAKKAGDYLLRHFRRDKSLLLARTVSKHIHIVQDKGADRIIIRAINKKFPHHNIISEESRHKRNDSEYTWIVDPLDGTGNYARGNPFFAVSIALMKNQELVLGVVYAPAVNELYVAEKGKGAVLNGRKIRVSKIKSLKKSYIVGCEGGDPNLKRAARLYSRIMPEVKDMRKFGSAAIEGCLVASSRAEAYATLSISPWDIAASVLIVQEAGGKVTDFHGKPWKPEKGDYLISNGIMHNFVLKTLRYA